MAVNHVDRVPVQQPWMTGAPTNLHCPRTRVVLGLPAAAAMGFSEA